MDIRDIKDPVQPYNTLREMFSLQEELLDNYAIIEHMPAYPLRIDLKKNQSIIKDFIARVVEELGEGYESYEKMYNVVKHEVSCLGNTIETHISELPISFTNNLYNFSEELSDALHFYLELLILLGVNYERLTELCLQYGYIPTAEYGVRTSDLLKEGRKLNDQILSRAETSTTIVKIITSDISMYCGTYYRMGLTNVHIQQLFWAITYQLQLVRNELKNKPWKQTGVLTDTSRFTELLVHGLVQLFGFFAEFKMSSEGIYILYYKKNQVNQFRIKSKY